MLAAEGKHCSETAQLVIQLLLPVPSGWDTDLGMGVEKDPFVALLLQPVPDPPGPGVVLAAVADEDPAHRLSEHEPEPAGHLPRVSATLGNANRQPQATGQPTGPGRLRRRVAA